MGLKIWLSFMHLTALKETNDSASDGFYGGHPYTI